MIKIKAYKKGILIDEKNQFWKASNLTVDLDTSVYIIDDGKLYFKSRFGIGSKIIPDEFMLSNANPIKLIKDKTPYLKYIIGEGYESD